MESAPEFSIDSLIEEHDELKAKADKLKGFVYKYNNGLFPKGFVPNCPIRLLTEQIKAMETYLAILRERISVVKSNK